MFEKTYEANENVWKVFIQPWSTFPLSLDFRGTNIISEDIGLGGVLFR